MTIRSDSDTGDNINLFAVTFRIIPGSGLTPATSFFDPDGNPIPITMVAPGTVQVVTNSVPEPATFLQGLAASGLALLL